MPATVAAIHASFQLLTVRNLSEQQLRGRQCDDASTTKQKSIKST